MIRLCAAALTLALVGCGGDNDATENTATVAPERLLEAEQPAGQSGREAVISEDVAGGGPALDQPEVQVLALRNSGSDCLVYGGDLSVTRTAFDQFCPAATYRDCDPVANGGWVCSANVLGVRGPTGSVSEPGGSTGGSVGGGDTGGGSVVGGTDGTAGGGGAVAPPSDPATAPITPGGASWADSYSVNGLCYIDSTFDHGAGDLTLATGIGTLTIREIRDLIGPGPGRSGNPLYNDVNCGNGPANNAGDEDQDQCPGRVDQGRAGCYVRGPSLLEHPELQAQPSTAVLRVEAEALNLGDDWTVQDSGIVWNGLEQGRSGNNGQPAGSQGQTDAVFNVTEPGTYRLVVRARAQEHGISGRTDLNNDFWVFIDGQPEKVFISGRHQYVVGGSRDDTRQPPQFNVPEAGQFTVKFAGRSTGFEMDYLELQRVGGATAAPLGDRLVSLHYDSSPDYDDLQAMVAARHVLDTLPDVEFIAVNGTIGLDLNRRHYIEGSFDHMRTLFPNGRDWFLDADGAVGYAADNWAVMLNSGGTVSVAEGGPSDFTAAVLRELERRGVGNLKRVTVVQHSHGAGFNEANTDDGNLRYVESTANFVRIDNGNQGGNRTADLAQNDPTSERAMLASKYGDEWATALSFVTNQSRRNDFSDTVELLHILDLPNTGGVREFTNTYITN